MALRSQQRDYRFEGLALWGVGGGEADEDGALGELVGDCLPLVFEGEEARRHEHHIVQRDAGAPNGIAPAEVEEGR